MKSNIRVGLIGLGAIAQLAHLPVLSRIRGMQLVALCDNDGAKARALADRFGVSSVFTDIEDLLDHGDVDAVIVATPNHLHEPHVLATLAAGKHVLCERPLSVSTRGIQRILAAADRTDGKVFVANNHRFRNDVQALDRFLRNGELGKLTGGRAGVLQHRGQREGWRTRRAESGGGAFLELGLPMVDLALWLADFPAPQRVTAHFDRPGGRGSAVEESALVMLECAQGIVFAFDVSWAYVGEQERWWFEVTSSRGSARLAPLRVVKELNGKPVDVSPTGASAREGAFSQSYRAELTHFAAVLRGEGEYEAPTDQVTVLQVLEAVHRSAEERTEIVL